MCLDKAISVIGCRVTVTNRSFTSPWLLGSTLATKTGLFKNPSKAGTRFWPTQTSEEKSFSYWVVCCIVGFLSMARRQIQTRGSGRGSSMVPFGRVLWTNMVEKRSTVSFPEHRQRNLLLKRRIVCFSSEARSYLLIVESSRFLFFASFVSLLD